MKQDDKLWYYDEYCKAKSREDERLWRQDNAQLEYSWVTVALVLILFACLALNLLLTFNRI